MDTFYLEKLLFDQKYEETREASVKLLEKDRANSHVWYCLARALYNLKSYRESEQAFFYSLKIEPDSWKYFHLSHLYLINGFLLEGFMLFEHRRSCWNYPSLSKCWQGEEIYGKTLLVWRGAAGFGDVIQYLRYLPYIQNVYGCNLLLNVHQELHCLFENLGLPLVDIHVPHDLNVAIFSLPLCFKATLSNIPPPLKIQCSLQPTKGRIGIVWRSGSVEDSRNLKSFELSDIESLLELSDYSFVCLQKKIRLDEIDFLNKYNVEIPVIDSFSTSAQIIESCELIISCDTSVPHLSASMGVPTWIVLHYNACWRWLDDRSDSPWYPSVRLFRQLRGGNWSDPVEKIRVMLADKSGFFAKSIIASSI